MGADSRRSLGATEALAEGSHALAGSRGRSDPKGLGSAALTLAAPPRLPLLSGSRLWSVGALLKPEPRAEAPRRMRTRDPRKKQWV